MTEIELKKLKRIDLLEMLIDQSKENEMLRKQLNEVQDQLKQREIDINKAGSIAEAALQLNGVFEAAQNAGAQYLENIERLSGEQEKVCARMAEDSKKEAARLLSETQQKCQSLESNMRDKCAQMLAYAEQESKKYLDEVSQQLEDFYEMHKELQELLPLSVQKGR